MLRALRRVSVAGVVALAVLFGFALPASARGRVVHAGQSIQAAIDAAAPGDTIIVGSGVYHENLSITKDDLRIIGSGATLEPPATPGASTVCDLVFADDPSQVPPASNGVCIAGEVDFDTFLVTDPVSDTRITGLHVDGFAASGIMQVGGEDSRFIHNDLSDNGEYGIFALLSTGTQMIANHASGSGEAGLYVGDSPDADARLVANDLSHNLFGIFVRDAQHLDITGNRVHDNCAGVFVLADAPGPAGDARLRGNQVENNNQLCTIPEDEGGGTIGGIGIALSGAHGVDIRGNIVTGNTAPAGVGDEHAGIAVVTGDGGTVATDNTVKGNIIKDNSPDILWDGAGDNSFGHNVCDTSTPDGLC
jgi:nitrous oxidase accessory protein NosD